MSAEQHHRFSIDYQQELRAPFFSTIIKAFAFWRTHPLTRELDLSSVYKDITELREKYGSENALLAGLLRFALDLWSLQQEITGRRHTQEIATSASIENGEVVFQNKRYPRGTNLKTMYEASLLKVTDEKIARYKRENDQIFALYSHVEPWIKKVHALLLQGNSTESLLDLGFTWHEIPITPSLLATVPSLFGSLSSMNDLYEVMNSGKTIRVLMAPEHLLTLSPQHWLHKKGKSTFWWDTRLIVLPDTKETAIIQNGIFSQTPLIGSLDFLGFEQVKKKKFKSEQELMQFINVVTTHSTIHPSVLLNMIVQEVDLFQDAEKIDPNVKEGVLDVKPYMEGIEKLLRFEFERISEDSEFEQGIEDRLLIATDLIKHKVARLDPVKMLEIIDTYKENFGEKRRAISPLRQIQPFYQDALKLDPGLSIKIDFSLIDCTVGSAFNGINSLSSLSPEKMSLAIDARFGVGAGEFLQKSAREGITTTSQLATFCDRFHLDRSRFHPGKCVVHGCPSTFVGECSVCPACEMLDNFGISRDWGEMPNIIIDDGYEAGKNRYSKSSIGIGDALSATTSGWQQFLLAA